MTTHLISAARKNGNGEARRISTRAMMTIGVAALGVDAVAAATKAIEVFDEFMLLHCPRERCNEGFINIGGCEVFFKFEFCDDGMSIASSDPYHHAVTQRVVSLICADEK